MKTFSYELTLSNIQVNTNGHDGGQKYIVSNVDYEGSNRRVSVFLKDKIDEAKLEKGISVVVEGILKDDGNDDLLMSNGIIIEIRP